MSKLKKIKTKFLRYTGYLNSIRTPIKQDLLLILALTRSDQKVRRKVLFYHIAFIDYNENSQIETTIHSKLAQIKIQKM